VRKDSRTPFAAGWEFDHPTARQAGARQCPPRAYQAQITKSMWQVAGLAGCFLASLAGETILCGQISNSEWSEFPEPEPQVVSLDFAADWD